jgi:hypothetical protein
MKFVLVIITVFSSSGGLESETAFQEFETKAACERAAEGIRRGVDGVSGTLGREVITQCHALGKVSSGSGRSQ